MDINKHKLTAIVAKLMHHHKGILAADESNSSANKRFEGLGIEQTSENRRRYRELLFTTPDIEKYISGVILYDETIRQMTEEGELFRDFLKQKGILVGIKVDTGLEKIDGSMETITKGLDGLEGRLKDYKTMNAVFTKWRNAFRIKEGLPTDKNIRENCADTAKYARLVQEAGMVPILEPEVLLEGDHTIETAHEVTAHVLSILFEELTKQEVYLGGAILKTSMVLAGSGAPFQVSHNFVAKHTADVLRKNVPAPIGGVVFLSGGQSPEYAVHNVNAIAELGPYSWPVTFSFGRALQAPALGVWEAKDENKTKAQKLFKERLIINALARQGKIEYAPGQVSRYHVAGLRGFFWTLVLLVIILLIVL